MNEFIKPSVLRDRSPKSMAIVIIARYILIRNCIFTILKREFLNSKSLKWRRRVNSMAQQERMCA